MYGGSNRKTEQDIDNEKHDGMLEHVGDCCCVCQVRNTCQTYYEDVLWCCIRMMGPTYYMEERKLGYWLSWCLGAVIHLFQIYDLCSLFSFFLEYMSTNISKSMNQDPVQNIQCRPQPRSGVGSWLRLTYKVEFFQMPFPNLITRGSQELPVWRLKDTRILWLKVRKLYLRTLSHPWLFNITEQKVLAKAPPACTPGGSDKHTRR